ncbi:hypothetical protein [Paenibacillus sp. Z6-24]
MDYQAKTDWNYNDTVTEQDMNRIEAGLGDLHNRLDTEVRQEIVLQPGTQTITAKRDTPFQLTGITGRMLLNLEARTWGPNKSMAGLAGFQSTITMDSSKSVVGGGSVKITATTANTIADAVSTKPYQLKAGKKYVVVGHIYNESAKSVLLALQGTSVSTPIFTDKGKWITAYMKYSPSGDVNNTQIVVRLNAAAAGNIAYADGLRIYEISDAEYTALDKMTADQIAVKYPYTEGLAGVRNPYAIRWANKDKTDVAAMLAFDTELLASPVIDVDADKLQQGMDGQYCKISNWRKVTLDGSQNWMLFGRQTGYTVASLSMFGAAKDTGYVIKYNGSILQRFLTDSPIPGADAQVLTDSTTANPNLLAITISNADSGWSDGYSPSVEELKAYFWGWVMGTQSNGIFTPGYNGSGTKVWRGIVDDNGAGTTTLPTMYFKEQYPQPSWQPYQLMYKFPAARKEPVSSEGDLTLSRGDNVIEVGSGLILREKVKPVSSGDGTAYYINARGTFSASSLVYNSIRPLLIYRNGLQDGWGQDNNGDDFGSRQAGIGVERFDKSAVYTVTYFTRNAFPAAILTGNYPETEHATLNDLIQGMQQITQRVSVVESTKQNTMIGINWLTPTLLNGWTGNVQYAKLTSGEVVFRGVIAGGIITPGTVIFNLPAGILLRSNRGLELRIRSSNGSADAANSTILVETDGRIRVQNSWYNTAVWFDGLSFIGEK